MHAVNFFEFRPLFGVSASWDKFFTTQSCLWCLAAICSVAVMPRMWVSTKSCRNQSVSNLALCLVGPVCVVLAVLLPELNLPPLVFSAAEFSQTTPENIFLFLFVVTVPLTLTLLLREEKMTSLFCVANFVFLLVIVIFMCRTTDFLGLVMGYELLFVPAFFIMRRTVYSAAAQSAYSVFTVWSVLGSLVVVSGSLLLFCACGVSDFEHVSQAVPTLSQSLKSVAAVLLFIGFGVKIPIWPFHYWLARVHVEASTGFSIFLSGFLVKAAVFSCWKLVFAFNLCLESPFLIALCLFSVFDGAMKLAVQTDLKKLVAFATVFEMGLIYLFLLWKPEQSGLFVFLFCVSHAFLSGLMFFIVEVIYVRTHTRNLEALSGLIVYFPSLGKSVWAMLFIFWGLPFTVKFFVEFWVLLSLLNTGALWLFALTFFVLLCANLFVTKAWLQILYGSPQTSYYSPDISSWEALFVVFAVFANTLSAIVFSYSLFI